MSGRCVGGSFWETIKYYFESQPEIAYPVAIVLGLLLLTILNCCVKSCIRRGSGPKNRAYPPLGQTRGSGGQEERGNQGEWVDPAAYNGNVDPSLVERSPVSPERSNVSFISQRASTVAYPPAVPRNGENRW
jgi:hypothetical protein